MWQKAKNKAKLGRDALRSPESPRRRFESDDERTPQLDKDKRGSKYEKSNRRHSQYKKDGWREDDAESDHQDTNALSDRRQSYRSVAGRPRIERRASSLDRGDFEKDRSRRRRCKFEIRYLKNLALTLNIGAQTPREKTGWSTKKTPMVVVHHAALIARTL